MKNIILISGQVHIEKYDYIKNMSPNHIKENKNLNGFPTTTWRSPSCCHFQKCPRRFIHVIVNQMKVLIDKKTPPFPTRKNDSSAINKVFFKSSFLTVWNYSLRQLHFTVRDFPWTKWRLWSMSKTGVLDSTNSWRWSTITL